MSVLKSFLNFSLTFAFCYGIITQQTHILDFEPEDCRRIIEYNINEAEREVVVEKCDSEKDREVIYYNRFIKYGDYN